MEFCVEKNKLSIEHFEIGRLLGTGRTGRVYKVFLKEHNELIRKENLTDQRDLNYLKREISIQTSLLNTNLLKLYNNFQDNDRYYILLEYCTMGTIYDIQKTEKTFPDTACATYVQQVSSGLAYMHKHNIAHRDIKPENLLLNRNGKMNVADFGSSAILMENKPRNNFVGTLDYVSPEVASADNYDLRVDVWSLGVVLFELLTGKKPFFSKSQKNTLSNIKTIKIKYPKTLSLQAVNFMKQIFQMKDSRPSSAEVLKSDYVKHFSEGSLEECKVMQPILEKIYSKRSSVDKSILVVEDKNID